MLLPRRQEYNSEPQSMAEALKSHEEINTAARKLVTMLKKQNNWDGYEVEQILTQEIKKPGKNKKQKQILREAFLIITKENNPSEKDPLEYQNFPFLNSLIIGLMMSIDNTAESLHLVANKIPSTRSFEIAGFNPLDHVGNSTFTGSIILGMALLDAASSNKLTNNLIEKLGIKKFYPWIMSALFFSINTASEAITGDWADWSMGMFSLVSGILAYHAYNEYRFGTLIKAGQTPNLFETFLDSGLFGYRMIKHKIKNMLTGQTNK